MPWFRRSKDNISPESQKLDLPDGLWEKCPGCDEIIHKKQLESNLWTCLKCEHHFRIGSEEYINILLDKGSFKELFKKMRSSDPLKFEDTKKYKDRLYATVKTLKIHEAVRVGTGKMNGRQVAFG